MRRWWSRRWVWSSGIVRRFVAFRTKAAQPGRSFSRKSLCTETIECFRVLHKRSIPASDSRGRKTWHRQAPLLVCAVISFADSKELRWIPLLVSIRWRSCGLLQFLEASDYWKSSRGERKGLEMALWAMEWMTVMTYSCALGLAPSLALIT